MTGEVVAPCRRSAGARFNAVVDDERLTTRRLAELPSEGWGDEARGDATWKTLFSGDVTGTADLTTGVCVIPVGGELAAHRHAVTESYFFLDGTGSQQLGPDVFDVAPGSSVMIAGGTLHSTRNTGSGPLRFFYVFATDSFSDVHYDFG